MKSLLRSMAKGQLVMSLLLILSQPVKGQDSVSVCKGYGKVGQIMVEVMLPLTAIEQMGEENRELFFEMAGRQAMEILFQGQITTPEAVNRQLYQQCTTEGVDALIEQMRRENTSS